MRSKFSIRRSYQIIIVFLLSFIIASCNLTGAPEEQIEITDLPTTSTALPTRTPMIGDGIPTASGVTPLPTQVGQLPPTSPVIIPTQQIAPANTPLPVSIFILSPIPGNVIAGNVQVIGSASHPEFLQYQLEYGPDPNPSNLWFPVTGAIQSTVQNGLLGIWNTTTVQDSTYQLRLRVFLRDGTDLRTVVNNVRVQNQAPTPIPTATPVAERPIAAFTQDRATGVAPLVVRFTNQSTGEINNYQWAFGDGSSSSALNPTHTFNTPGTYNVVLSVSGPGGTSNVSRQITVQSATPPIAAFTPSTTGGPAPLNVAFTNESQGNITSQTWNFGDGTTSEDVSPSHTFTDVGTYNVILTVQGPGGSSSVTRRITVEDASVPPPDAAFLLNEPVSGEVPLTVQFNNQTTGEVESYEWDFGDGATSPSTNPEHTFTQSGQYTVRLTAFGPGGQSTAEVQVEVIQPPDAPVASFDIQGETTGPAPLTVGFVNTSTGQIDQNRWTFNGDEITTDDDLVEYTFNEPGTYTVALQVSNQSGSDTATATVNVLTEIEPPVAQFQANPTSGPAPLSVQFQNQSTGDNLSYRWEIVETGQEISDTAGSFTYEFTESGNYTIRLTAANVDEGLIDTAEVGISVSDEVVQPPPDPLDAAFSAIPRDGDPATFDLSASAQGGTGNYSFTWEANGQPLPDGQQSSVTFPGPGEYTIILRVNDGEDQVERSQSVSVAAPAEPLDAAFSATPRDGDPATFDLSASAQGGTGSYSFTWQTSEGHDLPAEPQISVTFTTIGEQTIILRVNDGEDQVERSQGVNIPEPEPDVSTEFIMNTPIMPDWGALRDPLRQIHQSTETNTSVFGIAGDQTAAIDTYLQPFAGIDPDSPLVGPLRDIVVRYQSAISDGVNSFNYDGVATGDGLIALDFLTAAPAPGCEDGEILFVCEIRQLGNPSVILVHVGTNDIAVGTPRSEFESQLNQIIDRAVERGVIPILATTYPMAGEVTQEAVDVNEAIITVASGRNVPLFNQWRALAELSNNGLDGGGNPSVHPEGPAFVAESSDFGANMRNRYILLMLDALFRDVLN